MSVMEDEEFDFDDDITSFNDRVSEQAIAHHKDEGPLLDTGEQRRKNGLEPFNESVFDTVEIPQEFKELFSLIHKYHPKELTLNTQIQPFIPDYLPAFGEVDELLKVPRPDAKEEYLGLTVLDEPSIRQSDAAVLSLRLRPFFDRVSPTDMEVAKIKNNENVTQRIDEWIRTVGEIHKRDLTKPVSYRQKLPDIEDLMQQWPAEVSDVFSSFGLPDKKLDIDFESLVKLSCNLLQIPVFPNCEKDSLHLLFTLLLAFQENPYLTK